ncbi:DUF6480 family protein [Streptomyces sp. NPDC056728]
MSGAGPQETCNPSKGWAKAPLTLIIGLVVLVAAFFLVYAPVLLRCRNTPGRCGWQRTGAEHRLNEGKPRPLPGSLSMRSSRTGPHVEGAVSRSEHGLAARKGSISRSSAAGRCSGTMWPQSSRA